MYQLCKQGSAQDEYGADAAVLGSASVEGPEENQSSASRRRTSLQDDKYSDHAILTLFSALPSDLQKNLAVQL